MSPHNPDIHVHISAPSRASDDARYRQQLQGFLNFKPLTRVQLVPQEKELSQVQGESITDEQPQASRNPVPTSTHELLLQVLEDASQELREKGLDTPTGPTAIPPRQPAYTTPALVPNTIAKEPTNIDVARTPWTDLHRKAGGSNNSEGVQETPLPGRQHDSWTTPPSVIPDSQPTPHSKKRPLSSSSPSPEQHSSSPTAKRQRIPLPPHLSREVSPPSATTPPPTLPTLSPSSSPSPAPTPSSPLPALSSPIPTSTALSPFRPSTLQIWAPRPPTSTAPFRTHLTPHLTSLSNKPPLRNLFARDLLSSTRPLHPSERGHWLLPLTTLPENQQHALWDFLARYIGSGKAGWGVECFLHGVRGADGRVFRDEIGGEEEEEGGGESVMKIYCWGQVVEEIWKVLFVGSDKGVRGKGCRWVDAAGEVVIQMI